MTQHLCLHCQLDRHDLMRITYKLLRKCMAKQTKGISKIIPWQLKNTTTHHPFIFLFYAQIHRRKTSIFLYFPRWRNIPFHMSDTILTCISYFSQAIVCCQVIYKVLWSGENQYRIQYMCHLTSSLSTSKSN